MTANATFNVVQLGAQADLGTAVAAARLFPVDPGSVPDLDRATQSPDEDYGDVDRHHEDRGYHGVRAAQTSITAEARFEDVMDVFEMHVAGGVTPSASDDDFEWDYTFDSDTDTLTPYTLEIGDDAAQNQYQLPDCLIDQLDYGYDALTAPGASPWKLTATVFSTNRIPQALTSGLSAPSPLETMLGHHTTLFEGPTSEGFDELDELTASLAMFRFRSALGLNRLAYGAQTGDTATEYSRGRAETSFEAMVRVTATSKTNVHDIWNVASSLATERRWRVRTYGSGDKMQTIDAQVRFTAIPIGDRNGEHVYSVQGYFVKCSTLDSRGRIKIVNGVSSLPGAGS